MQEKTKTSSVETHNPLTLKHMEHMYCLEVLKYFKQNKTHAAKALGIAPKTLLEILKSGNGVETLPML